MEKQGLIEVVARGMWEETEASNGCAQPNMEFWRERASERLGEIWAEGYKTGDCDRWAKAQDLRFEHDNAPNPYDA